MALLWSAHVEFISDIFEFSFFYFKKNFGNRNISANTNNRMQVALPFLDFFLVKHTFQH